MTEFSLEGPLARILRDDDVVNFLKDNPDFFNRQQDLLLQLRIPHPQRGAISLVEIQLEKLRERKIDLEEEITQLMSIAAGNENLFRAFSSVHIALFSANVKKDIHQALDKLAASLNLTVSLRLYEVLSSPQEPSPQEPSPQESSPQKASSQNLSSPESHALDRSAVEKLKAAHFCGQRIYLGRLRKTNGEQFVSPSPELGSYALVPVGQNKELGFLSFASKDGGHFQPCMDTLFVEQLSEHIAILLTKWQSVQ